MKLRISVLLVALVAILLHSAAIVEKLRIVTRSLFYRSSNEWPSFEGANRKLKYSLKREYTRANSICPRENCLDSTKCEHFVVGATCPRSSDTCCSIVKSEYRTHCNHFAGECMDSCSLSLHHAAVDCPSDKVCCTLV